LTVPLEKALQITHQVYELALSAVCQTGTKGGCNFLKGDFPEYSHNPSYDLVIFLNIKLLSYYSVMHHILVSFFLFGGKIPGFL
jgi:hypothetical protein